MARPPEPEKRRQLARRAVDVLQSLGMDAPMAQLAEELGLKRPTLLYHFPSRAHIVETALEDLLEEQATFVLARLERHEHPVDRLYAQLCAVHEFHHGREARLLFLTQAIATTDHEQLRKILDTGNRVFEAQRQAMAQRLREGIHRGAVAPCDVESLIALVRALVDGLMVQRVMTGLRLHPVHQLVWERVLAPLKLKEWTLT